MTDKTPTEWDGEERRGFDGLVLRVMTEVREIMGIHEMVEKSIDESIREEIKNNRLESDIRHTESMRRLESIEHSTIELVKGNTVVISDIHKMFKQAFPEGDVNEHRKAHEQLITKEREDKEFLMKLKQDLLKLIAIAALGWGGVVIWAAFLKGPGA